MYLKANLLRISNKTLVRAIADHTGHPISTVKDVFQSMALLVPEYLSKGLTANLWGMGTFRTGKRTGRVLTGGPMKGKVQQDSVVVKFRPSKALSSSVRLLAVESKEATERDPKRNS